ncbi:MAG: YifB family Mg chelatase-like AAA ATPase [Candidatus Limnocylindrus sp.]
MTVKILSSALAGVQGVPVDVEVEVAPGIPAVRIVGLPDAAVGEARERIRAAIRSSGFTWPARRITVNLAPADLRKSGGSFDLPIALGILAASGQLHLQNSVVGAIGELALDGRVRDVPGSLPLALTLPDVCELLLMPNTPAINGNPLSHTSTRCIAVTSLADAAAVIEGRARPDRSLSACQVQEDDVVHETTDLGAQELSEIRGQPLMIRGLMLAATARVPILLEGAPGVGKSMAARALHGILPDLANAEKLEVAAIASAGGRSAHHTMRPPLRAPHHDLTVAGLIGGGTRLTPGEMTWAHRGLLVLDEIGEFRRDTIEALREPLETRAVRLSRAGRSIAFPADALVVATGNPCACGELVSPEGACRCTSVGRRHGSLALSAPIRSRFGIKVRLAAPSRALSLIPSGGITTALARERVMLARAACSAPTDRERRFRAAVRRGALPVLSGRTAVHVRELAVACATLDGRDTVGESDIAEALFFAGRR